MLNRSVAVVSSLPLAVDRGDAHQNLADAISHAAARPNAWRGLLDTADVYLKAFRRDPSALRDCLAVWARPRL